jgi:hypothetical protein
MSTGESKGMENSVRDGDKAISKMKRCRSLVYPDEEKRFIFQA